MSHTVFQTGQIMPINTHNYHIPTTKTLSSVTSNPLLPVSGYIGVVRKGLVVRNSSAAVDGDSVAALERCFRMTPVECPAASSVAAHGPVMKGGQYGAFGAVTLEKSKLDMTQKQTKSSPELAIGGGGGNIGKSISFGGGDGGDDDGDDDDYFDEFYDGDEGDDGGLFRRRIIFPELFDRKFLEAVLNEWQKTMMDLPSGLRQAYEMGLVSSAQLVKYIAMNARPTTARFISRSLPQGLSRGFIGRMIADPAFLYRFLLEQAATIGSSVLWEVKNRKERIKEEWDLALIPNCSPKITRS